jgi:hypothetical protein
MCFSEAKSNEGPYSLEVRQGTANIAIIAFARTFEMQTKPDPAEPTHGCDQSHIATGLAVDPENAAEPAPVFG